MDIIELKSQIIKNNLQNFYIFTGEEIGIINIYLKEISNKLGLPLVRAERVSDIYSSCTRRSMFGSEESIYVIRDDKDFAKQDSIFETIKTDIGRNVIILLFDKLDGRSKLSKVFSDNIVAFDKLSPSVLKNYIKKKVNLSDSNVDTLISLSDSSYDVCMLEADKILVYSSASGKNADESFAILLNEGQICHKQTLDIFKFVEYVMNRDTKLALQYEQSLRISGNSSVLVLGSLYSSVKSVLLIQCCNSSNISEVTGLDNGQVYFNKKYTGKYSSKELVRCLKLIERVVSGIKSGWIEDEYATRYVLSQML